ncbi:LysR substrate-binding domain-containing protein [Pseudodesulfovibrio sp. zrk46]|uniref:LysR family transcriptional regulator n=1 Tax=Pseudodesulfovibrio sp. zrk46 TaxID=2725288 RepID=UPI001449C684|nr:LysR substrate-binding domain-containing protein [Pseudodesulfovibrio sp. zrk46]QJB55116.1 LysR family transcriptional regulator [Pseudodesulfovibrio sp. zrk46]
MELRQLKYFVAVAEELNFTRAAERCHIAQPPLSQQIKKLEEELGCKLFDRTNRVVALTEQGKTFLCVARNTLETLDAGVTRIKSIARGEIGRLRIGFLNSAIHTKFPEALTEFRKRFPGIVLDIQEMESRSQKNAILDGELDVGLCHHCHTDSDKMESRTFIEDTYYLAVHENHPFAKRGTAGWDDLKGEPFIMFSRLHYPNAYERSIARFHERDCMPRIVQEARTQQIKLSLIAAGMGMGFVPERMEKVCPPCVKLLPFEWDGVKQYSAIKVAWRKGEVSTALRHFLDVLKEFSSCSDLEIKGCWVFPKSK